MNEINLTYCPEGGEHKWGVWYDKENTELVIDCDRCHAEAFRENFYTEDLDIKPIPVRLEKSPNSKTLNVHERHEV